MRPIQYSITSPLHVIPLLLTSYLACNVHAGRTREGVNNTVTLSVDVAAAEGRGVEKRGRIRTGAYRGGDPLIPVNHSMPPEPLTASLQGQLQHLSSRNLQRMNSSGDEAGDKRLLCEDGLTSGIEDGELECSELPGFNDDMPHDHLTSPFTSSFPGDLLFDVEIDELIDAEEIFTSKNQVERQLQLIVRNIASYDGLVSREMYRQLSSIIVYVAFPLIIIGFVTNVIAVKAFRRLPRSVTNTYMTCLICFDMAYLLFVVSSYIVVVVFRAAWAKPNTHQFLQLYVIYKFFILSARQVIVMATSFMSLDRYFVIVSPFRTNKLVSIFRRPRLLILLAAVLILAFNSHKLLKREVKSGHFAGTSNHTITYLGYSRIYMDNHGLLDDLTITSSCLFQYCPLFAMIVANIALMSSLHKYTRRVSVADMHKDRFTNGGGGAGNGGGGGEDGDVSGGGGGGSGGVGGGSSMTSKPLTRGTSSSGLRLSARNSPSPSPTKCSSRKSGLSTASLLSPKGCSSPCRRSGVSSPFNSRGSASSSPAKDSGRVAASQSVRSSPAPLRVSCSEHGRQSATVDSIASGSESVSSDHTPNGVDLMKTSAPGNVPRRLALFVKEGANSAANTNGSVCTSGKQPPKDFEPQTPRLTSSTHRESNCACRSRHLSSSIDSSVNWLTSCLKLDATSTPRAYDSTCTCRQSPQDTDPSNACAVSCAASSSTANGSNCSYRQIPQDVDSSTLRLASCVNQDSSSSVKRSAFLCSCDSKNGPKDATIETVPTTARRKINISPRQEVVECLPPPNGSPNCSRRSRADSVASSSGHSTTASLRSRKNSSSRSASKAVDKQFFQLERHKCVTVIIYSFLFFILALPLALLPILKKVFPEFNVFKPQHYLFLIYVKFFALVDIISASMNFFVFYIKGGAFRAGVYSVVRCKKRRRRSEVFRLRSAESDGQDINRSTKSSVLIRGSTKLREH